MGLENLERKLNVIKTTFTIIFYVVLTIVIILLSPKIIEFYKHSDVTKASIAGVTLSRKQELKNALNLGDELMSPTDNLPNPTRIGIANKINSLEDSLQVLSVPSNSPDNWIYAGGFDNSNDWSIKFIVFDNKIRVNNIYQSINHLNIRNMPPVKTDSGWTKGKIISVLDPKQYFRVEQIDTIPGGITQNLIWLRIKILKD